MDGILLQAAQTGAPTAAFLRGTFKCFFKPDWTSGQGPGRHATRDIPRMVAEAAESYPDVTFTVTDPLGVDPKIGQLILDRAGLSNSSD